MTNKGKVLAAVVAVVVVLGGAVGLYLKGGDLMGKLWRKSSPQELTISSKDIPSLEIMGSSQMVGSFLVFAPSDKDILVKSIEFSCSGSYTENIGLDDNSLEVWVSNKLVASAKGSCVNGITTYLSTPLSISAKSRSGKFEIRYDTSVKSGAATGETFQMFLNKVYGNYPASRGSFVSSNSPVAGPVLVY